MSAINLRIKLVIATAVTAVFWSVGSTQSPGVFLLLRFANQGRFLLLDKPFLTQIAAGALQGLALALPLWWVGKSMRWHHALAAAIGGYLTSTYRLTMPLWALGLVQPAAAQGFPGLLLAQRVDAFKGYAFVPIVRPFLAGLLVGLVLQHTSKRFRWRSTLVIALGWSLTDAIVRTLFRELYPLLFVGGRLLRSQHYLRWSLGEGLVVSALLYFVLARNGWGQEDGEQPRALPGSGWLALARPNLFTHYLTRGHYRRTLWTICVLTAAGVVLGQAFIERRPEPASLLLAIPLWLTPPLLVAVFTANLTRSQRQSTAWELVRLSNVSENELAYACFQGGLHRARWVLAGLILLMAWLSFGLMRIYTGLFLSLSPLTLPNPLKWKLSLISLPFFLGGVTMLGAAVGARVALHVRSWGATVLAPATMLAVMLLATVLAQNYYQGILSLVSEAILFALLPWLAGIELMRLEL